MLRNPFFAAGFVTIYLVVYCALTQFDSAFNIAFSMFLFGPLLIVWMVYTVLKFGKYTGKELGKDEFGYQDKDKSELGTF